MRRVNEERIDLMMRELSHRSKNLLTVVEAIARQIARRTQNFVDFEVAFATRLGSFAEIHDLLKKASGGEPILPCWFKNICHRLET